MIGTSHANQLRDPEIQDLAGVRRKPVGPPRLQDASWPCIERLEELMASSKERRLRSNTSKDLVDVETQLNAEETGDTNANLKASTRSEMSDAEAPDGREKNGGLDCFSLNWSWEIKTIDFSASLHRLAEQIDQPSGCLGGCRWRALKSKARSSTEEPPHFNEELPKDKEAKRERVWPRWADLPETRKITDQETEGHLEIQDTRLNGRVKEQEMTAETQTSTPSTRFDEVGTNREIQDTRLVPITEEQGGIAQIQASTPDTMTNEARTNGETHDTRLNPMINPVTTLRTFSPIVEELRIEPEERWITLRPIVEGLKISPEMDTKVITPKIEELKVNPERTIRTITPRIEELKV